MDPHTAVIAASWLTSGWIDVAMISGWMALVVLVGRRVWQAGGDAAPPTGSGAPTTTGQRKRKRRAR